ncbi:YkgJ family cysteine cluster protein [Oceanicoccus sp. KOV_DT_Chl]|uniref:YkgJ family cysteine cluster protein n=1 Tax=Oceanicoccus sp. KOV_DT_Chl TaxID=1904639 RepID=UPI000C7B3964|nr:YkgJ family cysteine cluster protein [Oceanicoccus sp. KOV_DT_Chl]
MKDCNQCGKCCIHYGNAALSASRSDIESWELFRPDIAAYVRGDEIWFDPASGEQLHRCPWLQQDSASLKYTCDIYEDRPEDCRHYPVSIDDMIKDDCEMLEVKDLNDRKQAQQTLDRLMSDSRPPLDKP